MTRAEGPGGLGYQVYLSPTRVIAGDRTFSPVSSTLFTGERDAVLVDAQFYREDVAALGDMIARSGKRLTTIYVTHGHSDHYFGAGEIVRRFPGAKVAALPSVADYIGRNHAEEVKTVGAMFGDRAVVPNLLPQALDGDTIELEGHSLKALDIGQGDISPSTTLWVETLRAAVPGDIVYNGIHMMLGLTGPEQWDQWIRSIDAIEALAPAVLVAGHKRAELPDDEPGRMLAESRAYIRSFAEVARADPSVDAIVSAMSAIYPSFGNLTTLVYSAHMAVRRLTGRSARSATLAPAASAT